MKALRSFTVRPQLPEPLAPLHELAMNLRWSWDERTRDLFRWVDPDQWEVTGHDPVRLLGLVRRGRLEALAKDPAFLSFMREVHGGLERYLGSQRWFQDRTSSPLRNIAYFSPEFGIAEALPQYSGGLGVLAGDHLKAASGLGIPLVGVGLLYRQGYFRQELNAEGWQQERYPALDPHTMAVTRSDARIEVDLAGVPLHADVWHAHVGRVLLYLLDADLDENEPEGRLVTDRLYGGNDEHKIRQQILLGVGGVRALQAIGEEPQVFHTNEGHAGFLGLERIRQLMTNDGLTFAEATEAVRAATVFTTHTPVPAGIPQFPRDLMERYFKGWTQECGVTMDELMALGHAPGVEASAPFNMAVMGLRLAARSNGVARLHGETSRRMFQVLWPDVPVDEVPITSVTNGVHANTWISPEMADLLTRYITPAWHEAGDADWERVDDIRDDELWRAREQGRDRLVNFVRQRVRASLLGRGASSSDVTWADEVLDPRILTVGFARRFATYKRADLLLSQPDRLKALLLSPDRPIQIVFAGKAHPADDAGKDMIRRIIEFSHDPAIRHRFTFVEDYDIAVARTLYQGSDVWLNNPRRPQEACGTSGEKAALNGALNCSILDGWWDEMFNGENGWAITSAESYDDLSRRDAVEAASLFDILERQIVPMYYERIEGPVPRRWVRKMKTSLRTLGPRVTASRMLRDYVEQLYEPTAQQSETLAQGGYARAKELSAWKHRVATGFEGVRVVSVDAGPSLTDLGGRRTVEATVQLGTLSTDDVAVELLHGPVGPNDELGDRSIVEMELHGLAESEGQYRYRGGFVCERAGRYGFTVRAVPAHDDLVTSAELGVIAWA